MPISVNERHDSRQWRNGGVERLYDVYGSNDDLAIRDELESHNDVPAEYDGLIRQWPPDLDPIGAARGGHWRATVRYVAAGSDIGGQPSTGEQQYNFEIGGMTARITNALATTRYPATAPDTDTAIGVTANGVEGIDRNVPTSQFAVRKFMPAHIVTPAYEAMIEDMAFTVNNNTFRGRPAGTVLFIGATGAERPAMSDYELTFRFMRRRNRTNITIGEITGINVEGWQYLETRHEKVADSDDLVQRVVSAYVHQIYEYTDFADLQLDAQPLAPLGGE